MYMLYILKYFILESVNVLGTARRNSQLSPTVPRTPAESGAEKWTKKEVKEWMEKQELGKLSSM